MIDESSPVGRRCFHADIRKRNSASPFARVCGLAGSRELSSSNECGIQLEYESSGMSIAVRKRLGIRGRTNHEDVWARSYYLDYGITWLDEEEVPAGGIGDSEMMTLK
jgi:hypothetical protein